MNTQDISVVICIHKPSVVNLNRCLQCVIPQAREIVVVSDKASVVPKLALCSPNLRYLWMDEHDVGFGQKMNYGSRHTQGKLIWFLNDDCFVAPDCGSRLLEVLNTDEKIGLVGHELRYPDGTLQHGGTWRPPGVQAYVHLDTHEKESRFKEPVEMENVTAASMMARRQAFDAVGGFCAGYHLYLEDQHLCLALRQKGWKIFYTPHAKGIHLEHQSTKMAVGIQEHIRHSWKVFQDSWGPYFTRNRENRGMGVFT